MVIFSRFFKIGLFCFVVAKCDLMHDVETMHGPCVWNSSLKYE